MIRLLWAATALVLLASCSPSSSSTSTSTKPTITVTYSILGSLVADLVGDAFAVHVLMPDGMDPHEWEPSARDLEALNASTYVVTNGLGLEGGLEGALEQARTAGIPFFTASEHLTVRLVKAGEGLPTGDEDQAPGAQDPHLWMAPAGLERVVAALADDLQKRFGVDLSKRSADLQARLAALDDEIRAEVARIPSNQRLLVTGHESLGYFAEAYGFTLVGAIIPSLSTRAEVSASDMASLKAALQGRPVKVIFTEQGTPPRVAEALGRELGLRVVELTTHRLGTEGSYFSFLKALAGTVVSAMLEG